VLKANTTEEAIRLAGEHAGGVILLVTEVVMPEMNGRDLSEKLKTLIPNLKTLFVSGYTLGVIAHQGAICEGTHFLAKPFSAAGLAQKVREVLDGP
jgi:YesN/AraC family two-component response regulator